MLWHGFRHLCPDDFLLSGHAALFEPLVDIEHAQGAGGSDQPDDAQCCQTNPDGAMLAGFAGLPLGSLLGQMSPIRGERAGRPCSRNRSSASIVLRTCGLSVPAIRA
jgi:hypothetical protein